MVYDTYNELVNGGFKPSYNWGAPHCTINHSEIGVSIDPNDSPRSLEFHWMGDKSTTNQKTLLTIINHIITI